MKRLAAALAAPTILALGPAAGLAHADALLGDIVVTQQNQGGNTTELTDVVVPPANSGGAPGTRFQENIAPTTQSVAVTNLTNGDITVQPFRGRNPAGPVVTVSSGQSQNFQANISSMASFVETIAGAAAQYAVRQ